MIPKYIPYQLENYLNISHIAGIHFDEFGTNFHFAGERHDFWEMVYVDKGQIHISTDENEFDLKQGCIAFHKPNEFHTLSTDETHVADVFIISFISSSPAASFFEGKIIKLPANLQKKMIPLFREGLETFEYYNERLSPEVVSVALRNKPTAPLWGEQMVKIHLEEFLILLIHQEIASKGQMLHSGAFGNVAIENQMVEQVVHLIDQNVYEHITVNDVCDLTKFSRAHLAKKFKSVLSMSIGEYITFVKIKEAKKLIRENKYTFQEIADMLKFENQHYFSRVFKKTTNFSPTEYKNSVLK